MLTTLQVIDEKTSDGWDREIKHNSFEELAEIVKNILDTENTYEKFGIELMPANWNPTPNDLFVLIQIEDKY